MPSSTIERRSSGSITARSFSVIWSCVGSGIGPILAKAPQPGAASVDVRSAGGRDSAAAPLALQMHVERRRTDVGDARWARPDRRRWGSRWRWRCCCWPRARRRPASTRSPSAAGTSDADADWADTTGGAKFRPDAYCVTPPGADPFDGAHLKSFTRSGAATVSGTRFARWRWEAPPGTGDHPGQRHLVAHAARRDRAADRGRHLERRLRPVRRSAAAPTSPRATSSPASPPAMPAIEDRLLCARAESKWCSLEPGSWSAVRALTITVEDDTGPAAGIGGDLTAGGWRRGAQGVGVLGHRRRRRRPLRRNAARRRPGGADRVPLREGARSSGEWRGTRMQPCRAGVSGAASVDTTRFSDGPHALGHCATDFAGNVGCIAGAARC